MSNDPTIIVTPNMPVAVKTPAPAPATPATPRAKRSWGDAYTWMLILSLLFLAVGCAMLAMEWSVYGFQIKPSL